MDRNELINSLRQLHHQLMEQENVDDETKVLLETVTNDIRNVLTQSAQSDIGSESLSERIRNRLIEFEARHPQLGGLLERITDGLAGMGI